MDSCDPLQGQVLTLFDTTAHPVRLGVATGRQRIESDDRQDRCPPLVPPVQKNAGVEALVFSQGIILPWGTYLLSFLKMVDSVLTIRWHFYKGPLPQNFSWRTVDANSNRLWVPPLDIHQDGSAISKAVDLDKSRSILLLLFPSSWKTG